jgi:hypothetical protein
VAVASGHTSPCAWRRMARYGDRRRDRTPPHLRRERAPSLLRPHCAVSATTQIVPVIRSKRARRWNTRPVRYSAQDVGECKSHSVGPSAESRVLRWKEVHR